MRSERVKLLITPCLLIVYFSEPETCNHNLKTHFVIITGYQCANFFVVLVGHFTALQIHNQYILFKQNLQVKNKISTIALSTNVKDIELRVNKYFRSCRPLSSGILFPDGILKDFRLLN